MRLQNNKLKIALVQPVLQLEHSLTYCELEKVIHLYLKPLQAI
jgi:hypothetical protein